MSGQERRHSRAALAGLLLSVLGIAAACGGQPGPSVGAARTDTPSSPVAPSRQAGATPSPSAVIVQSFPHDAPDLEAMLPDAVAARPLSIWSMDGTTMMDVLSVDTAFAAELRAELERSGSSLDDIAQGIAGRADVAADPPYFVYALQVPVEVAAARTVLLDAAGFRDEPAAGDFEERTIGGKSVLVGPPESLVQNVHQRGAPYVYAFSETVTFIVITDDPGWAEEALAALP